MNENIKIKKHYKNKYTTIDNILINDMSLSFQAKGLFLFLWSKPDDWKVNVKQMQHNCIDKQTKIYSALKELEEKGYLIRKRFYINGKVAGINYNLSDTKDYTFDEENLNQQNLNQENLNQENKNEYIYIQNKDNTKIKTIQNKDYTKEEQPIFEKQKSCSLEKENDFIEFYKTFEEIEDFQEKTKNTKHYKTKLNKFLKEAKNSDLNDILVGTRNYLIYLECCKKTGFNRAKMDVIRFINNQQWDEDWDKKANEQMQNISECILQKAQQSFLQNTITKEMKNHYNNQSSFIPDPDS
jgi:hypothetical protein